MTGKEYNHPSYINVPYFVLQDERLDPVNKMVFSFIWSLSVSGKKIEVSNGYLATLLKVSNKHINCKLKELEDLGFIRRFAVKYKRMIEVLYLPSEPVEYKSEITETEQHTPVGICSTNIELTTPTGGGGVHLQVEGGTPTGVTYNKDNNKDYNNNIALFDEWYSHYPRKKGKALALKWFKSKKPNAEFVAMITKDVQERVRTEWKDRDEKFIPYASTYLSKSAWEDGTDSISVAADNEKKIREREIEAQIRKREEIESAKNLQGIIRESGKRVSLKEMVASMTGTKAI